jgi:hypothetical protein
MKIAVRRADRRVLVLFLMAATAVTALSHAGDRKGSARIPFAAMGGIQDWKADGDKGLYVESLNHKWFYARFMSPCTGLKFRDRVAFMTEPGGELDQFSAVVTGDQRCYFKSFAPSAPPT